MSDTATLEKITAAVGGLLAVAAGAYATVVRARKSRPPEELQLPIHVQPVTREQFDAMARRIDALEGRRDIHAQECDEERATLRADLEALEKHVVELDKAGLRSLGEIQRELGKMLGWIDAQRDGPRTRR